MIMFVKTDFQGRSVALVEEASLRQMCVFQSNNYLASRNDLSCLFGKMPLNEAEDVLEE
jgi:hypothetical protein